MTLLLTAHLMLMKIHLTQLSNWSSTNSLSLNDFSIAFINQHSSTYSAVFINLSLLPINNEWIQDLPTCYFKISERKFIQRPNTLTLHSVIRADSPICELDEKTQEYPIKLVLRFVSSCIPITWFKWPSSPLWFESMECRSENNSLLQRNK